MNNKKLRRILDQLPATHQEALEEAIILAKRDWLPAKDKHKALSQTRRLLTKLRKARQKKVSRIRIRYLPDKKKIMVYRKKDCDRAVRDILKAFCSRWELDPDKWEIGQPERSGLYDEYTIRRRKVTRSSSSKKTVEDAIKEMSASELEQELIKLKARLKARG